jgi:hypothetical protein
MKKTFLIIIGLLISLSVTNAQYKVNKKKYNYRTYSYQPDDPYNPTVMGAASLVIPGFGQILEGENGRGIAFFCANLSLIIIKRVERNKLSDFRDFPKWVDVRNSLNIGKAAIHLWSAIDAARVAKVNNLVFRDKNNISYYLNISPYLEPSNEFMLTENVSAGLRLSIAF